MATVSPRTASWFRYFPDDYRWSSAVGGMLGSSTYGGADISEVDHAARGLRDHLGDDGVVQRMRGAFLLTHGADDEQISMADAQALHDAVGSKDKTFRVFTTEEGGSQHCQRDYLVHGVTVIYDWFAEKL